MQQDFVEKVKWELSRGLQLSVISILDHIINHAHDLHASDIHFDPHHDVLEVRFRIDGVLQSFHLLPIRIRDEVISRIKILSKLRTDEHQATQDGRFRHTFSPVIQNISCTDIRVSIVPTHYGENAVLRLLSDTTHDYSLEKLGFAQARNTQRQANIDTILNAIGQNIADNKGVWICNNVYFKVTIP